MKRKAKEKLIKAAARLDGYLSGDAAPYGETFFSYNTMHPVAVFDACLLAEAWMSEHPSELREARRLVAKRRAKG